MVVHVQHLNWLKVIKYDVDTGHGSLLFLLPLSSP